jgi:hypothetical protein
MTTHILELSPNSTITVFDDNTHKPYPVFGLNVTLPEGRYWIGAYMNTNSTDPTTGWNLSIRNSAIFNLVNGLGMRVYKERFFPGFDFVPNAFEWCPNGNEIFFTVKGEESNATLTPSNATAAPAVASVISDFL